MFDAEWFFGLEKQIRQRGADSDAQSFDEIRDMLARPRRFASDAFAEMCAYVILAGGFSQKTAKKIHYSIMNFLKSNEQRAKSNDLFDSLFSIFHNKNKINAIIKIWENRDKYCAEYYACDCTDARVAYLATLPHIGRITANHLARNLGEDVVKYDIWIQRLGVAFAQQMQCSKCKVQSSMIDNGKLNPEIKDACDEMFAHLVRETGLPRGYIDVVLWKACQIKLISMDDCLR